MKEMHAFENQLYTEAEATIIILLLLGKRSIVMNVSFVHVCPFEYLVNHTVKLHQIFVAYYVWGCGGNYRPGGK